VISETDDFFCHQAIQPHAYVALNDLSWGERAYHTLSDPDRFGLDIGVATYPNRGMFHTYAIAAVPGRQWSLRATRDYSEGRWELRAGPIEAKIVEPMRRWTYQCAPNESGIAFDLEFEARSGPYMIAQPPIRKGGRLIHEDVYVFQAGFYSGTVTLDGTTFDVDRLEARVKESDPLIGEVCVIGNDRPYNVALIVPDPDAAARFRGDLNAAIAAAVDRANERLARVEQLKRFHIVNEPWMPGGDELIPTIKLKRRVIVEKYTATIDALYEGRG
jgi:hypothetical protein